MAQSGYFVEFIKYFANANVQYCMHLLGAFFASIFALFQGTFLIAPAPPQAHVTFVGDMMFDRTVRTTIDREGGDYIFSCIDPTLQSADLVVGNLEGPITPNDSQSAGSQIGAPDNYVFTFPIATAALLAKHNIRAVSLGNNHIMNFGESGVRSTEAALADAHVQYFGDPLEQSVATTNINGIPLALINYNEFGGSAPSTLKQITSARAKEEVPIVYTHWGVEYATTSPQYVRDIAHEFVDAGAAIVIGSHPHVVEDTEVYKGKYIYYSLGNFIFDQYWNDAVRHGLLLQVAFTPQGVVSIKEIPIELENDRRTCPIRNS